MKLFEHPDEAVDYRANKCVDKLVQGRDNLFYCRYLFPADRPRARCPTPRCGSVWTTSGRVIPRGEQICHAQPYMSMRRGDRTRNPRPVSWTARGL